MGASSQIGWACLAAPASEAKPRLRIYLYKEVRYIAKYTVYFPGNNRRVFLSTIK